MFNRRNDAVPRRSTLALDLWKIQLSNTRPDTGLLPNMQATARFGH
jgi:hypothetical protein